MYMAHDPLLYSVVGTYNGHWFLVLFPLTGQAHVWCRHHTVDTTKRDVDTEVGWVWAH